MSETTFKKVLFSGICVKGLLLVLLLLTTWALARYSFTFLPQTELEVGLPMFLVLFSCVGITIRNFLLVLAAPALSRSRK
jgi:hypothetical protein